VDGDVTLDREYRSLRGFQVFIVAAILAAFVAVLRFSGVLIGGLPGLMSGLVPVILLCLGFAVIYGLIFGVSPQRTLRGAGRMAGKAARSGARAVASGATRGAAGGLRGGGRLGASSGGMSTDIAVRRFRVRSMTGELVSCVQHGDLEGDEIRHGDYVLVDGRRKRDGHLLVRYAEVLQGPNGPTLNAVRTRRGAHGTALVLDRIALGVGLAMAAGVAVVVVQAVS
jgi:hypothetical protein